MAVMILSCMVIHLTWESEKARQDKRDWPLYMSCAYFVAVCLLMFNLVCDIVLMIWGKA